MEELDWRYGISYSHSIILWMEEILHHLGWLKANGRNYRFQLVQDFFHPPYHIHFGCAFCRASALKHVAGPIFTEQSADGAGRADAVDFAVRSSNFEDGRLLRYLDLRIYPLVN